MVSNEHPEKEVSRKSHYCHLGMESWKWLQRLGQPLTGRVPAVDLWFGCGGCRRGPLGERNSV